MEIETLIKMSESISRVDRAIWVGSIFIWPLGFYILYQLYHHKFLLWLIWGQIVGVVSFVYDKRQLIIGYHEYSPEMDMLLFVVGQVISFTSLLLSTVGAVMALYMLQTRFREKQVSSGQTPITQEQEKRTDNE